MSGRILAIGLIVFAAIFGAALWWFQTHAFYVTQDDLPSVTVRGQELPVEGYRGIDATSSPLKLRACFRMAAEDMQAIAILPVSDKATPLIAPSWFGCFDAASLSSDIAAGLARAVMVEEDSPHGFDRYIAVYPDGRAYMWRQLNGAYED